MSLLIKGMEMPTGCDDCEFCKRDISGYDWCCVPMMNGRDKPLDEPVIKPDWCHLVPVPPHGRLIEEADAIETAWMILRGLGYFKEENPQLEQTVREVFATAQAIEVE